MCYRFKLNTNTKQRNASKISLIYDIEKSAISDTKCLSNKCLIIV